METHVYFLGFFFSIPDTRAECTLHCDFSNIQFSEGRSSWISRLLGHLSHSVANVYWGSSWDLALGSTIEGYLN